MMLCTTQWLNADGDITLGWTEDQIDLMTEIIERKMAEGYTFFIHEDDGREIRLKNIDDLKGRNKVTISDKEAELLIRQGKIGIVDVSSMVQEDDAAQKPVTRAKSARQAASGRTTAVAAKAGG